MEGGRGRNGGTGQNRRLRRENPCWARGRGGHRKARRSSGPGEVWDLRGGSGEVWGLRGGSGGGPRDSLSWCEIPRLSCQRALTADEGVERSGQPVLEGGGRRWTDEATSPTSADPGGSGRIQARPHWASGRPAFRLAVRSPPEARSSSISCSVEPPVRRWKPTDGGVPQLLRRGIGEPRTSRATGRRGADRCTSRVHPPMLERGRWITPVEFFGVHTMSAIRCVAHRAHGRDCTRCIRVHGR